MISESTGLPCCQGCGVPTASLLACPKCSELGKNSVFCSQECFGGNWAIHSKLHAILAHNKMLQEDERARKRQAVSKSALNAIQDLLKVGGNAETVRNRKPPILFDEEPQDEENKKFPVPSSKRWIWLLCLMLLKVMLVFWFWSRGGGGEAAGEDWGAQITQLREEMSALRNDFGLRVSAQESAQSKLAGELHAFLENELQFKNSENPPQTHQPISPIGQVRNN